MKGIKDASSQSPPPTAESHPGRNATERLLKIHQLIANWPYASSKKSTSITPPLTLPPPC